MTMVAACHFGDGAVIIADSRVTWEKPRGNTFSDTAQKIIPIAPKVALSFAGDVELAAIIGTKIKTEINKNKRSRIPTVIASHLPRVAKFCFQDYASKYERSTGRKCSVSFILSGVHYDGKVNVWICESPAFILQAVGRNPVVIGSGNVVRAYLQQKHKELSEQELSLKDRANSLLVGLGDELGKHGVDSVGGLFQIILLSKEGIAPLNYGFYDLNPEAGNAKEMQFEKGRWVQKDLTRGLEVKLLSPNAIIQSTAINKKFHDYDSPIGPKKEPRWHLIYFMTCMIVHRELEKTEFEAPITQVGWQHFPRVIPIPVYIGLWGSNGEYKIQFYLSQDEKRTLIQEMVINIQHMPEQNEFAFGLLLNVEKPGPAFLDCYVGGQFLGRRGLYFGKVNKSTTDKNNLERIENELIEAHEKCNDPELVTRSAIIDYFIICEKVEASKAYYRFIREPKAVYYKSYPLLYRTTVAIGVRLPKGQHKITVDLVNVANRVKVEIGNVLISPKSDCMQVPIEGDLIAQIPSKGLYFFNVCLNGAIIGSKVMAFEDDDPMYSYSLLEQDRQRIRAGEYIALMKGSVQKEVNAK